MSIRLHTDEQHQHIHSQLQWTTCECILRLDLQAVVKGWANLRDTTTHKVDIVFNLRFTIHLLVARAEHTDIHIEVKDISCREHLLQLHCLLHARHATHLRAVTLTHLLVTRSHAVQDSNTARHTTLLQAHIVLVEHLLQISRGDDIVVDAIAILLLNLCIKQCKTRSDNRRITLQLLARREGNTCGCDFCRLAASFDSEIWGCFQSVTHLRQHLIGRREGGK